MIFRFLIDALQTLTLCIVMGLTIRNILRRNQLFNNKMGLVFIPIAGLIQLLFASIAILIIQQQYYIPIYELITGGYIIIEVSIITHIYKREFHFNYLHVIVVSTLPLLFILIFYPLQGNNISYTNLMILFSVATSFFIIVLCLIVYSIQIFDNKLENLFNEPFFYFNSGVFILYSTSLPINLLRIIMKSDVERYFFQYSLINFFSYIIFYYSLNKYLDLCRKNQA